MNVHHAQFFSKSQMPKRPKTCTEDAIKTEIHNRMWVALAAYAYEVKNHSIISDAEYDALALSIRPEICTGNAELDAFFRTEFAHYTGSWVHQHPGIKRLAQIYENVFVAERAE